MQPCCLQQPCCLHILFTRSYLRYCIMLHARIDGPWSDPDAERVFDQLIKGDPSFAHFTRCCVYVDISIGDAYKCAASTK